ncbi:hypothetical protein DVH05_005436 [Phytophthora capsici]|nr:hypothetical protein DVH05_005436 [Phytophthora capsici]
MLGRAEGDGEAAWRSRKPGRSGRRPSDLSEAVAKIKGVPVAERQILRRSASAAGVTVHQVSSVIKSDELERSTGRIKPSLTLEAKLRRLEFALAHVDESSMEFEPMYDVVHIDE